jgi:hypothetical protein
MFNKREKINFYENKGYFQKAESAIREYLITTDLQRKNQLFKEIIDPALRALVKGILRMPKFQKIIGISISELEEGAYYHVIFQLERFNLQKLGKEGKPAKTFSYFGTCIKNYILGLKIQTDKRIAKHGGILNVNDIKTDIPQVKYDFQNFEDLKSEIVRILKIIPEKYKLTKNDIIVNNSLRYMLENWHSIEFQDKNEFVRLLINYTQLTPNVVSTSLKKIRSLLSKNTHSLNINKKKHKTKFKNENFNLQTFF